MIVEALHPALVGYVPLRGRHERHELVAMRSPLDLPEDDLSRSVDIGPLFPDRLGCSREPVRLMDGRLWSPLHIQLTDSGYRDAGLDDLVGWLAGDADLWVQHSLAKQFSATPLVAIAPGRDEAADPMARGYLTRGKAVEPAAMGRVLLDGRDRARADLVRYVADWIRILDGRPFVRCAPFLFASGFVERARLWIGGRISPEPPSMWHFPCTPETLDAALSVHASLGTLDPDWSSTAERMRWEALIPQGALAGEDVRWILSTFAEPVARMVILAIQAGGDPFAVGRLKEAQRAIRPIAIASMTGTAHLEGDAPALVIRQALAALPRQATTPRHGEHRLAAFLDAVVIPGIDARSSADLHEGGLLPPL